MPTKYQEMRTLQDEFVPISDLCKILIGFVLNILSKFIGKGEVYICAVTGLFTAKQKKNVEHCVETSSTFVKYASNSLILTTLNWSQARRTPTQGRLKEQRLLRCVTSREFRVMQHVRYHPEGFRPKFYAQFSSEPSVLCVLFIMSLI